MFCIQLAMKALCLRQDTASSVLGSSWKIRPAAELPISAEDLGGRLLRPPKRTAKKQKDVWHKKGQREHWSGTAFLKKTTWQNTMACEMLWRSISLDGFFHLLSFLKNLHGLFLGPKNPKPPKPRSAPPKGPKALAGGGRHAQLAVDGVQQLGHLRAKTLFRFGFFDFGYTSVSPMSSGASIGIFYIWLLIPTY